MKHSESSSRRRSILTGHANANMVRRYIRIAGLSKRNATEDMGL